MAISSKDMKILIDVGFVAKDTKSYVGAQIRQGGKALSTASSNISRGTFGGKMISGSNHAEINAINCSNRHARRRMRTTLSYSNFMVSNQLKIIDSTNPITIQIPSDIGQKHKPHFKNATMYISRIRIHKGQIQLKNASPCGLCVKMMLLYGIKKICYTTEGGACKVNLKKYVEENEIYITGCTMRYKNGIFM